MKISYLLKKILIKIIPVKKNRIVFISFGGHYSDSPKYICEEIHKLKPTAELVWLVDEKYKECVPTFAKAVKYNSFKSWYYFGSANIIIDNVYGEKEAILSGKDLISKVKYNILKFLNYKKNQFVYTTWHGMPIKRMGRDQVNSKEIYDFSCPNTTMFVNDKHTYEIMNHINFEKINMKLMGTPRNDILYKNDINTINELKMKLNLPVDKKIIMFVPTFRSENGNFEKNVEKSGLNQLKDIDFEKLFDTLNYKFGGEWIFLCRFHYHVEKMVDWNEIKRKYGDKVLNGNKCDDIMEYMMCTDILISDISSALCDFIITNRPVFNLFPDYENYKNNERGLYIAVDDLPFNINTNFKELVESIQSFNIETYLKKINAFKDKYGYVYNSDSSKQIAEYILKERKIL